MLGQGFQAEAGGGVGAGAKGLSGIEGQDDLVVRCRPVDPRRMDDQALADPEGRKVLLPVAGPVVVGQFPVVQADVGQLRVDAGQFARGPAASPGKGLSGSSG